MKDLKRTTPSFAKGFISLNKFKPCKCHPFKEAELFGKINFFTTIIKL
jgi:hypothetical protein